MFVSRIPAFAGDILAFLPVSAHDTDDAEDIRLSRRLFLARCHQLLPLARLVDRGRAAADSRADERTLLAADQATDAGAGAGAAANDHRGLAPRAVLALCF